MLTPNRDIWHPYVKGLAYNREHGTLVLFDAYENGWRTAYCVRDTITRWIDKGEFDNEYELINEEPPT